jgi:periplasmic protein TonB
MLAYAASRRRIAERPSSPNAMLLIACAHIALIAVVMSAKMDLPRKIFEPPIKVDLVPQPAPPQPQPIRSPSPHPVPNPQPRPDVSTPASVQPTIDTNPTIDFGKILGPEVNPNPRPKPVVPPVPVRHEALLLTPPSELKPPYPASKLASEEEAALTLRLSIDEQGRVIDVQPVGSADKVFLATARRYLMAHWRYRPATDDGHAVATSIVITLRFMLDA